MNPQVVDFARLKRISTDEPVSGGGGKSGYNTITQVCLLMIFIGFAFLIKRFKDKKSHLQSDTHSTLQRTNIHLFS
jgi:hypothetical protein